MSIETLNFCNFLQLGLSSYLGPVSTTTYSFVVS